VTRLLLLDKGDFACLHAGVFESLRGGGTAIYPTDTLYGLGVDPRSEEGLRKLSAIKGREGDKPIPLLLDVPESASLWASHVSRTASRIMEKFWPGALTVVLPARDDVSPRVTAGGNTVGLRVPDHSVPRALARGLGGAITGTSANRAGDPGDWGSAEDIVSEFTGEVDWILWDGPPSGLRASAAAGGRSPGSTVVRVDEDDIVLLREGAIPLRHITEFLRKG
jgi:L-threonylcarbamoyladenylate synthase